MFWRRCLSNSVNCLVSVVHIVCTKFNMFRVMGLREGVGLFSKTRLYGHPWQPIFLPFGYSSVPNRRACTFISNKVCLLSSIDVKRQTLLEINVHVCLFGTLEGRNRSYFVMNMFGRTQSIIALSTELSCKNGTLSQICFKWFWYRLRNTIIIFTQVSMTMTRSSSWSGLCAPA